MTTLKDLKNNDWFKLENDPTPYKRISEVEPQVYGCEDSKGLFLEVYEWTEVEKIDGFSLYLLNGGRVWD